MFGGNRFDPNTGHYNARLRDHDPKIGCFTQMDDWHGVASAPMTLYKYMFRCISL